MARAGANRRVTEPVKLTKRQENARAAEVERQVRAEVLAPPRSSLTLAQWAGQWLTSLEGRREPATIYGYSKLLRARILPELGHIALMTLTRAHVLKYLDKLTTAGRLDKRGQLTENSRRHHLTCLSSLLSAAVAREIIPLNPALGLRDAPRPERREALAYNAQQIQKLVQALPAAPPWPQLAGLIGVTAGLRRGEVCALTWSALDLIKLALHVKQAVDGTPKQQQRLKSTKSVRGIRQVPLPGAVMARLLDAWSSQLLRAQDGKQLSPFCLVDDNGTHITPDRLSRAWKDFITDSKLPKLTFHGLRHTYATQMLQVLDVRTVAELLGEDPAVMLRTYAHVLERHPREGADLMNGFL